jgi:hypothetical protein
MHRPSIEIINLKSTINKDTITCRNSEETKRRARKEKQINLEITSSTNSNNESSSSSSNNDEQGEQEEEEEPSDSILAATSTTTTTTNENNPLFSIKRVNNSFQVEQDSLFLIHSSSSSSSSSAHTQHQQRNLFTPDSLESSVQSLSPSADPALDENDESDPSDHDLQHLLFDLSKTASSFKIHHTTMTNVENNKPVLESTSSDSASFNNKTSSLLININRAGLIEESGDDDGKEGLMKCARVNFDRAEVDCNESLSENDEEICRINIRSSATTTKTSTAFDLEKTSGSLTSPVLPPPDLSSSSSSSSSSSTAEHHHHHHNHQNLSSQRKLFTSESCLDFGNEGARNARARRSTLLLDESKKKLLSSSEASLLMMEKIELINKLQDKINEINSKIKSIDMSKVNDGRSINYFYDNCEDEALAVSSSPEQLIIQRDNSNIVIDFVNSEEEDMVVVEEILYEEQQAVVLPTKAETTKASNGGLAEAPKESELLLKEVECYVNPKYCCDDEDDDDDDDDLENNEESFTTSEEHEESGGGGGGGHSNLTSKFKSEFKTNRFIMKNNEKYLAAPSAQSQEEEDENRKHREAHNQTRLGIRDNVATNDDDHFKSYFQQSSGDEEESCCSSRNENGM